MRQLTFLLIIILPFTILAQNTSKNKQQKLKQILMGLNLSPDYSYRTLKSDGPMFSGSVVSSRNNQEVAKFGYTVGLNIYFNITSRAAFETGIQYSNKGYKTELMDLVWLQPDPSLPTKGKFIYNISYLDIPAKINLTFGEKKLRFCAG